MQETQKGLATSVITSAEPQHNEWTVSDEDQSIVSAVSHSILTQCTVGGFFSRYLLTNHLVDMIGSFPVASEVVPSIRGSACGQTIIFRRSEYHVYR